MGNQSKKPSPSEKKKMTTKSKSCKRFVSKTNINPSESAAKLSLTEAEKKNSSGDTRRSDPSPAPGHPDLTEPEYWADDELTTAESDYDIVSPGRTCLATPVEAFGCHYCAHCGVIPVTGSGQYCLRCKQTKHEWFPDKPTRKLRHKVYKRTTRARRSTAPKPSNTQARRVKHTSRIKSKLKALMNRRGRKPLEPPLSKFSNLKCHRRCGHTLRCTSRSGSSSSTGTGQRTLRAKAEAFRKRRDYYFYKHHKYPSAESST